MFIHSQQESDKLRAYETTLEITRELLILTSQKFRSYISTNIYLEYSQIPKNVFEYLLFVYQLRGFLVPG